jgi:hypothetical protein
MENKIFSAQSTQLMNESFKNTTIAMAQIANEVNPKYARNMIKYFEKFNNDMASFTEMIEDATEETSIDDYENEVGDNPDTMVGMILSEIGIEAEMSLPPAPLEKDDILSANRVNHGGINSRVDKLRNS